MGNDMRKISAASLAILTNVHAIAVSQDPLGQMGIRVTPDIPQQIWARVLANGDRAVALYNKGDWTSPKQPPVPHGNCPNWTATGYGYYEASGPAKNVGSFRGARLQSLPRLSNLMPSRGAVRAVIAKHHQAQARPFPGCSRTIQTRARA